MMIADHDSQGRKVFLKKARIKDEYSWEKCLLHYWNSFINLASDLIELVSLMSKFTAKSSFIIFDANILKNYALWVKLHIQEKNLVLFCCCFYEVKADMHVLNLKEKCNVFSLSKYIDVKYLFMVLS